MILVEGAPVAAFIEGRLGVKLSEPFTAFGFVADDHRPLCAFVFNDFTQANMEMTIFAEPGGITRGVLRYVANYVFNKNNCRRLTVRTKKRNKAVLRLLSEDRRKTSKRRRSFGFQYECVAKHFYTDDDAVVFRMLRDDCKWL